ncbi:MAG: PD40 domain-containing protein [Sedimentisphaerales bacterium]|nr:PD40 domain-containing protein [Sedimentisphaerales bacterium]
MNSSASESDPEISADGLSLFFQSDCPGGYGYPDLWVTRRLSKDSPWEKPVNLGPTLNAGHYDGDPEISPDGLSLFLCIYGRVGGYGGVDLWVSRRATPHDPWADPVNLGPIVNGAFGDSDPSISADGSVLYFSSNRSGLWEIWQAPIGPIVDFNGDGTVDGFEVKAMANHWGTDDTLYDIGPMPWGDGIVDAHDLIALAKYIGAEVDDPTLVAHWRLDETDGTTVCDSIGSHHGMVIGVPVWWPEGGRVDGALELSGMTFIMASFVLNPADGPFSVLAWVKGGQPGQGIIAQQGGVDWLHVDAAQGNLTTELSRSLCSQIVITDGNWHRVGVTWDGSACQLYVDDVLEAESTEGELASSTDGIVIGCRKTVAGTFFTGLIDDVRIYNRAVKP